MDSATRVRRVPQAMTNHRRSCSRWTFPLLVTLCLQLCGSAHGQVAGSVPVPVPVSAKAVCADPGIPDFGYRHGNAKIAGAVISFGCDNGFELSGARVRRCSYARELGRSGWSGVQPICDLVHCPLISTLRNGSIAATSLTFESVARFTCRAGYGLSNLDAATITCQANGQWSQDYPTCEAIACGEPEGSVPAELNRLGKNFTFGSDVKYSCKDKTRRIAGEAKRQCLENGQWSGSTPTCEALECPGPDHLDNGGWDVSSRSIATNDTVLTYFCNRGYMLTGGPAERICRIDGSWSHPAPTCPALPGTKQPDVSGNSSEEAAFTPVSTPGDDFVLVENTGSALNKIPILAGLVAAAVIVLLLIVLAVLFISKKRKANSDVEKGNDRPDIYANSALFSPTHERQSENKGKRLSTTSVKTNGRTSQLMTSRDDISEESSQMSSETPPLPSPPNVNGTSGGDGVARPIPASPTQSQENNVPPSARLSTASLGAVIGQLGTAKLAHNKRHRRSDPLPVVSRKPARPAPPVKSKPIADLTEESEYGTEDLYDDTLIRHVGKRPHGGTISKRPAAPLPPAEGKKVAAVLSLNPLERLHRSQNGSSRSQVMSEEDTHVVVIRHSAIEQNMDEGCYSEIDGNEDEEHLYEPVPNGSGNRLSFSYDDVMWESEEDDSGMAGQRPAGADSKTMSLLWRELQSDMDLIDDELELNSPATLPPVPSTEEYDLPADALISGDGHHARQKAGKSLKRATILGRHGPPPVLAKRPVSVSTLNSRTAIHVTNSASSFQSDDDYHLPLDATPVSFTAMARANQPYDVPLESIEFAECYNGGYAFPADCTGSGQNSRHNSQKRKSRLSTLKPTKS